MTYSPLVDYVAISPHKSSPRNNTIKKITIHHMAGNLTVEQCGQMFKDREASTNYGIDNKGRVGCYVYEEDRSWGSSSRTNDNQAITMELANDEIGGNWHVSDLVIEKCIELCVDICKRNNIPELIFTGDTTGNLTMHKMFTNTLCPGPYLSSKFPYIAEQVNARLKGELTMTQYDELSARIKSLESKVNLLEGGINVVSNYACVKFNHLTQLPDYYKVAVSKLVALGVLEDQFLALSEADAKMLTILDSINAIDNNIEYAKIEDVPDYGKDVVQRMINAGVLKGDGIGLGITEQTVKLLVYLDRMSVLKV